MPPLVALVQEGSSRVYCIQNQLLFLIYARSVAPNLMQSAHQHLPQIAGTDQIASNSLCCCLGLALTSKSALLLIIYHVRSAHLSEPSYKIRLLFIASLAVAHVKQPVHNWSQLGSLHLTLCLFYFSSNSFIVSKSPIQSHAQYLLL